MRGIIFKPSKCCKHDTLLGKVINISGVIRNEYVGCNRCNTIERIDEAYVYVDENKRTFVVETDRVKILPGNTDFYDNQGQIGVSDTLMQDFLKTGGKNPPVIKSITYTIKKGPNSSSGT